MDPNVRYDPTSMGLDYNITDTWANLSQDIKLNDEWDKYTEAGFAESWRHTNLTAEQWRDPTKTTRTWPDPPIARRSWSLDAHLGVHAGNSFNVTLGTRVWLRGRNDWAHSGGGRRPRSWGECAQR